MKREMAAREKRSRFIAATEKGLSVSAAAEAAGVNRTLLYKWRQRDPGFARQWDDATTAATEGMEDEALRRALQGVEKPVFYRGKQVGAFRTWNDRLLILLLQRRRPSPSQQEALRFAEEQLAKQLKAVEQREAALRQREEALRKMSPTVSIPAPALVLSPTVSAPARPSMPSSTVPVLPKPPVPSPTVSVPSHPQQGTASKAAAGSAGILPASARSAENHSPFACAAGNAGGTPALPGNALLLSPTVSVPARVPMLAIADHVYGRHYESRAGFRLAVPLLQRASSTTHTLA